MEKPILLPDSPSFVDICTLHQHAMRYYRLWIYICNFVLALATLVFTVFAVSVLVDPRISLLSGVELYQPTFIYAYIALIIQCGVLQTVGCIGALRLNQKLLNIYWILLLILLIGDVVVGLVWAFRLNSIKSNLKPNLRQRLNLYYKVDPDFTKVWDWVQQHEICCGVDSPDDFHELFTNDSLGAENQKSTLVQNVENSNSGPSYHSIPYQLPLVYVLPWTCCTFTKWDSISLEALVEQVNEYNNHILQSQVGNANASDFFGSVRLESQRLSHGSGAVTNQRHLHHPETNEGNGDSVPIKKGRGLRDVRSLSTSISTLSDKNSKPDSYATFLSSQSSSANLISLLSRSRKKIILNSTKEKTEGNSYYYNFQNHTSSSSPTSKINFQKEGSNNIIRRTSSYSTTELNPIMKPETSRNVPSSSTGICELPPELMRLSASSSTIGRNPTPFKSKKTNYNHNRINVTYHRNGCLEKLEAWVDHVTDILFVIGFCIIVFLKGCFLAILRYEIKEMIQKIRLLNGNEPVQTVGVNELIGLTSLEDSAKISEIQQESEFTHHGLNNAELIDIEANDPSRQHNLHFASESLKQNSITCKQNNRPQVSITHHHHHHNPTACQLSGTTGTVVCNNSGHMSVLKEISKPSNYPPFGMYLSSNNMVARLQRQQEKQAEIDDDFDSSSALLENMPDNSKSLNRKSSRGIRSQEIGIPVQRNGNNNNVRTEITSAFGVSGALVAAAAAASAPFATSSNPTLLK